MMVTSYFLLLLHIVHYSCRAGLGSIEDILTKQQILSQLIRETLESHHYHTDGIDSIAIRAKKLIPLPTNKSNICHMCDRLQYNHFHDHDMDRFSCCAPTEVRHLYNTKIAENKLIYYNDGKVDLSHPLSLPQIKSMKLQHAYHFNMDVIPSEKTFDINECKHYFNGTLHVVGRGTVKNVYHSVADNFIPLVTQIFEDYILDPEFLYLPRLQLVGFQPNDVSEVPHIHMIDNLMSAGSVTVQQAHGMCFRRILWGHGTHILYFDVFVHMRRITADFTRNFVNKYYKIPIPESFRKITETFHLNGPTQVLNPTITTIDTNINQTLFFNDTILNTKRSLENSESNSQFMMDGHPMRITLFTRGTSGRGRTIQGEDKLIEYFQKAGAVATICCDFARTSMEDQIGYAYHADAIVGLHGAALAHAIFSRKGIITLELKTLYGYTSILFALISDSRMGYHSQVDIRDHFVVGGHRPIDEKLVDRVATVLKEAINIREEDYKKLIEPRKFSHHHQHDNQHNNHHHYHSDEIRVLSKPGDFVLKYANDMESVRHMLGPKDVDAKKICSTMIFTKLRKHLASTEEFQCANCEKP